MELSYKGVSIWVSEAGLFCAKINATLVQKNTLKSMHRAIDKAKTTQFEPRAAFRLTGSNKIEPITIVGVKIVNPRSSWRRGHVFLVETKTGEMEQCERHDTIYIDTPQNREAVLAWVRHEEESEKIRETREREENRLSEKIKEYKPSDPQFDASFDEAEAS